MSYTEEKLERAVIELFAGKQIPHYDFIKTYIGKGKQISNYDIVKGMGILSWIGKIVIFCRLI